MTCIKGHNQNNQQEDKKLFKLARGSFKKTNIPKKYTAKELQLIEVTTFKAATTGQYDEDQIITSIMNMILKPNEEWSAKKKKPKYTYQDHFMIKLTKKNTFWRDMNTVFFCHELINFL